MNDKERLAEIDRVLSSGRRMALDVFLALLAERDAITRAMEENR
jgi:hypothetical protein